MFGYVRTADDLNRDNNDGTFEGVPLTSSFCAFDPNMPTDQILPMPREKYSNPAWKLMSKLKRINSFSIIHRIVCFSNNSSVDFPFDEGATALCYTILVIWI